MSKLDETYCDCEECREADYPCQYDCGECQGCLERLDMEKEAEFEAKAAQGLV